LIAVVLVACAVLLALALLVLREDGAAEVERDCPTVRPADDQLVGRYRTDDPRMAGATLQLLPGGRFQFVNGSGKSGSGTWDLEMDYEQCWQLILTYSGESPEANSAINRPLRGKDPPYVILFFATSEAPEATIEFHRIGASGADGAVGPQTLPSVRGRAPERSPP